MSTRYLLDGMWREYDKRAVHDYDNDKVVVILTEVANLRDQRTGRIYDDGAFKVTVIEGTRKHYKIFKGETAWNDSGRYVSDVVWSLRMRGWD